MNAITLTGNTNVRETGAPKLFTNSQGEQIVRTFEGIYADLLPLRPPYGSFYADLPPGFYVDEVELTGKGINSAGTLVVHLTNYINGPGSETEPIWERSYEEIFKDIICHPKYHPDGNGASKLTDYDVSAIAYWKNEPDYDNKIGFKFRPDPSKSATKDLTANAKIVAGLILKSVEGFNIAYPVITATTFHFSFGSITASGAWFKQSPSAVAGCPAGIIPNGYQWVRISDAVTHTRRNIQRHRRWMGVHADTYNLYPDAPV
jgi:hypothetical protein